MARLILKVNYFKPGRSKLMGGYASYVATRDGVEKLENNLVAVKSSAKQEAFIEKLVKDFPTSAHSEEYKTYQSAPTVATASEFITRTIEDNLPKIIDSPTYADYIATRPRAERIGNHGLFTSGDEPIVLSKVSEELNNHQGNVWTLIASLRREDAERLGFDNAKRWKDMIGYRVDELAKQMNIPCEHLKWYAAFHNEGNHPHIHIIVYSTHKNEGFITKQGIDALRSCFAKEIFEQDMQSVYEDQTQFRNKLKAEAEQRIRVLLNKADGTDYENPKIEELLQQLSARLKNVKGKKVYGYLDKATKDIVDAIIDELQKDKTIGELYDLWYEKKYEILGMYSSRRPPKMKMSENETFKSIKNTVINEAKRMNQEERQKLNAGESSRDNTKHSSSQTASQQHNNKSSKVSATAVSRLFKYACNIFRDDIGDQRRKYDPKVDRRLKREDEAKRNAEILYD